jgi:hypothetical protein
VVYLVTRWESLRLDQPNADDRSLYVKAHVLHGQRFVNVAQPHEVYEVGSMPFLGRCGREDKARKEGRKERRVYCHVQEKPTCVHSKQENKPFGQSR